VTEAQHSSGIISVLQYKWGKKNSIRAREVIRDAGLALYPLSGQAEQVLAEVHRVPYPGLRTRADLIFLEREGVSWLNRGAYPDSDQPRPRPDAARLPRNRCCPREFSEPPTFRPDARPRPLLDGRRLEYVRTSSSTERVMPRHRQWRGAVASYLTLRRPSKGEGWETAPKRPIAIQLGDRIFQSQHPSKGNARTP